MKTKVRKYRISVYDDNKKKVYGFSVEAENQDKALLNAEKKLQLLINKQLVKANTYIGEVILQRDNYYQDEDGNESYYSIEID